VKLNSLNDLKATIPDLPHILFSCYSGNVKAGKSSTHKGESIMAFPNFAGKHAHDAIFNPQDFIDYMQRQHPLPIPQMPQSIIFCYQRELLQHILAHEGTERVKGIPNDFHLLKNTEGKVGVYGGFGIGAPSATTALETFIALGVRTFVSIGLAGTLQPTTRIGDIIVCNSAIRDEGVSYHYLEAAKYAYPSEWLTARLAQSLEQAGHTPILGSTWTIDAPYRETIAEARHYQQEGTMTVEMEAAALFAVAQYRGVDMAAAFVISDSLAELAWNPQFDAEIVGNNLVQLYQATCAMLVELSSQMHETN
jgi:uridine phosphorylase